MSEDENPYRAAAEPFRTVAPSSRWRRWAALALTLTCISSAFLSGYATILTAWIAVVPSTGEDRELAEASSNFWSMCFLFSAAASVAAPIWLAREWSIARRGRQTPSRRPGGGSLN